MSDVTPHAPQLSNCPYCGERPTEGEEYVDVNDEDPVMVGPGDPTPSLEDLSYEITRCVRFQPCGHAFEEESIDAITDALRELRSLKRERKKCEDSERLKELDYEIEAQVHAVNNRASEATRRPEADDTEEYTDE